jgi:hypothetical protein
MRNSQNCCRETPKQEDLEGKLALLQSRIDNLLAGNVSIENQGRSAENDRLYAEFLRSDKSRASGMAAVCMKRAKRVGGVEGLEAAINYLYESLDRSPAGMVEYATKLFLTHYGPAREMLQIRSLEEREPSRLTPSQDIGSGYKKAS